MKNCNVSVSGEYRIQKYKKDILVGDTGWFDNLITDNGLDNLTLASTFATRCHLGAGNTPPTFSDTALQIPIKDVSRQSSSASIDQANRYWIEESVYFFAAPGVNQNFSEIGITSSSGGNVGLVSRALILDTFGNPTTLTQLADEDLVVTYRLKLKQPVGDFTGVASGIGYTIRAAYVDVVSPTSANAWMTGLQPFRVQPITSNFRVGTGTIGSITSGISPATSVGNPTKQDDPYVPGSSQRTGSVVIAGNQGNVSITAIQWQFGPTCWQAQFDTPIEKTSPRTLRFSLGLSWSREP